MKIQSLIITSLFATAMALSAATTYTVTEITVFDVGAGTSHTLDSGTTGGDENNFVPTDHLTLSSYTVGGTTYSSSLVSAVGSTSLISPDTASRYLQPKGYAAANPSNPFFPDAITGASIPSATGDVVPYLTEGSNGLDFATAFNLRNAPLDNVTTFTFDMTFTADPTTAGVPAFFAGDSAGGQSSDGWTFLDSMGNPVTNQIVIDATSWTAFDQIDLEPILPNGTVQSLAIQTLSFSTWSLESADFLTGKSYEDVASVELRIPATGDGAKTDYTFIGINNTIATSPNAVIPEPSRALLALLGLSAIVLRRRRTVV